MTQNKTHSNTLNLQNHIRTMLMFLFGFSIAILFIIVTNVVNDRQQKVVDLSASDKFPLVSPLIFCEQGEGIKNKNYSSFRYKVEDYVNNLMTYPETNHISVYFRDLNNGPWFGINESESFIPSSLLKLPILISSIKENEENNNSSFFDKTIKYDGAKLPVFQHFLPEKHIEAGKTYSIRELLERGIVYSDNEAIVLVHKMLGDDKLRNTYNDLGLVSPNINIDFSMNVKEYASFFRILFNSSYISKEGSESALELLASTKFKDGLRADIPTSIPISHKFGERFASKDIVQLHDCGIVYAPKKPYLLCVMTRGSDFDKLSGIIKSISNMVYEGVTKDL